MLHSLVLYTDILLNADKPLNQARPSTTRCQPCNVALGPDNPAYDHYHSRAHINRLLQLGLEIPIEDEKIVDDSERMTCSSSS